METEQNIKTKTIVNLDPFKILYSFRLIQMSKLKIRKQTNNTITTTTTQQLVQRKMKIKKQINSTYKRKKRKAYREREDLDEEEQEDLKEKSFILDRGSQIEASFSKEANNQSMLLLATTNKVAKGGNVLLFWLAFVTAINIAQLICDTSNKWSVLGADLQETQSRQRFAKEPEDTLALLGQPVELPCVIENKRGAVSWRRGGLFLGIDEIFSSFSSRYSMPDQRRQAPFQTNSSQQQQQPSNNSTAYFNHTNSTTTDLFLNDEQTNSDRTTITNSSLYIKSVSLVEDDYFQCSVAASDGPYHAIKSNSIKLTVLQPPSKLSIGILDEEQAASAFAASSQDALSSEFSSSSSSSSSNNDNETSDNNSNNNRAESQSHDKQVERFSVIEDTRLRLACRANQAKPHAELCAVFCQLSSDTPTGNVTQPEDRELKHNSHNEQLTLNSKQYTNLVQYHHLSHRFHIQLVWLDHQQQQVPKKEVNLSNLSNELNSSSQDSNLVSDESFVEELVSSEPSQPKLASSTLVWSFTVKRHHSNQLFTCVAKHSAFEQERAFPQLYGKQLKRQVRLEVLYKPAINLTKNISPLYEDKTVKFNCEAHARPNKLKYRWFIDTELVTNASDSELRIDRLTRQMHSRFIVCEVSNQVGSSRASMKLDIKYSPAFITHQLPASLQPEFYEPIPSTLLLSQQRNHHNAHRTQFETTNGTTTTGTVSAMSNHLAHNVWKPTANQLLLARQLAITYEEGHDVQLRCDFDSNPGLQQVLWYKVNTNYSIWANITPSEADEFIALGAMHAAIKRKQSQPEPPFRTVLNTGEVSLNEGDLNDDFVPSQQGDHEHNKRHIITNDDLEADLNGGEPISVDYQQMSSDLLDELSAFEMSQLVKQIEQPLQQQQQQQQQVLFDSSSKIELIPMNVKPTQTDVYIQEPLGWTMTKSRPNIQITDDSHAHRTNENGAAAADGVSSNSIQLAAPKLNGETTFPAIKFKDRRARVSSSLITLPAARRDVDVIGKYICKAKPADGFPASARAVYLVKRQGPRIISHREQWATPNKGRAQIECLAQVNTITDSSITWSKDGKLILDTLNQRENNTRKYWQSLQASPDLLFMRSTLFIEDIESSDFGEYICRVSNSINSDSTPIKLSQYATTGYVFTVMASLSIATALVLVCAFIMLLTYTPQQKIDAKVSMSNIKTVSQLPDRRSSLSSQKSTTESSQTSGIPEQGVATYDDNNRNNNNNQKQLQQQQHCDVNQMNQNNDAQYVNEQINSSTIPPIGSYQQPMQTNGEQSYYTTLSIQPLMNRPCYATICLPGQPAQPQCQFVPTSDAGDAFIDANYDTLIRNSSANKTTNYVPASPTIKTAYSTGAHINGAYASSSLSSSSSPNSLTTHTNLSNNYNHHHQQQQDPNSRQQYNHLQSELINGTEQLYAINNKQDTSNNQVTLILTNGTTTTNTVEAKNLNFNSLATHV